MTHNVEKGNAIQFIVENNAAGKGGRVKWDPVITFEDR